eukprot:TRINITY_DN111450_c0_g1_i1.p1 TRINITY_DN111450_c0_g1~~TRINITY_DN111450_c0_g1_i1.p1  ORF type:complete len:422 (-),score=66.75 TRINITY_DN111450_c0_g1_i1:569-1696(-)
MAGYAAGGMIPSDGMFRDWNNNQLGFVLTGLMNDIVSAVIGLFIMMAVDTFAASKATHQARERLFGALSLAAEFADASFTDRSGTGSQTNASFASNRSAESDDFAHRGRKLLEELDALRDVLPYAATETPYWHRPFKMQLYVSLEAQLRTLHLLLCAVSRTLALPCHAEASAEDGQLLMAFRQHVLQQLMYIRDLAASLSHRSMAEDVQAAEDIQKQLRKNLYTFKAAGGILSSTRAVAGMFTSPHSSPDAAPLNGNSSSSNALPNLAAGSAQAGAKSFANASSRAEGKADFWNQLQHETLRVQPRVQTPSTDVAPEFGLEEHVLQLRLELCAERTGEPGSLPHEDRLCCVELLVVFMRLIQQEVRKMQMAAFEF